MNDTLDSRASRRTFLALSAAGAAAGLLPRGAGADAAASGGGPATDAAGITWRSTTQHAPWRAASGARLGAAPPNLFDQHVFVRLDQPLQEIAGFGGAFTEKGW